MKILKLLSFLFFVSFASLGYSQESEPFKPSGKIIARSFFDYSQGFGHVNKESGFDLTRAFLGYNYKFTPTLQARVVIDGASGRTSDNKLEVYVRNAYINWADKGFDISVGEIGLMQFSVQESYWKHRYVMKSFQDLNKMAPSVDLGATIKYKFNDYVSADISLTNGEGYKKIKKNNSTRYAAGMSLYPVKNIIFRVYADIYTEGEDVRDKLPEGVTDIKYTDQKTLSLFAGYQDDLISGGLEYNRVFDKGFVEGKDYYGYSGYASVKVAPQWRIYARYDWMDSKTPSAFTSPWNDLDGQLVMGGVEFQPAKQLKISPNFRNINPDRGKSEQYLFVNVEFNL
ncbi:MAG: outer membrane beta-barrel protein [Dysgonomonas sp.]|nr:outer membrane beta-barrel protein [Dysgonomonas sp.]